jgi:hypothetical protein
MAGTSGLTPGNLVLGPARAYLNVFDPTLAIEPGLANLNTTPAASAGWYDTGITLGGTSIDVNPTFTDLSGDQLVDALDGRMTAREILVSINMTEMTQTSLNSAWNMTPAVTGSGYSYMELNAGQTANLPTYRSLLIDGLGPQSTSGIPQRRRAILRKLLPTGKTSLMWDKKTQQVLAVQYKAYFVSETISPIRVIDPQSS